MEKVEQDFLNKNVSKPIDNCYYWVTCVVNGKTVIAGCRNTESDAEQFIYEKNLESGVKIHKLSTRDINAASRMIRGKRLNEGEKIDQVMQRFKRKL